MENRVLKYDGPESMDCAQYLIFLSQMPGPAASGTLVSLREVLHANSVANNAINFLHEF